MHCGQRLACAVVRLWQREKGARDRGPSAAAGAEKRETYQKEFLFEEAVSDDRNREEGDIGG